MVAKVAHFRYKERPWVSRYWAIDLIGSTPTAVMGALEPMTAVMVGVIAFGEVLTPIRILGILMILVAVVLLTTDKSK